MEIHIKNMVLYGIMVMVLYGIMVIQIMVIQIKKYDFII